MIRFIEENGALIARLRNETIRIEGWGNNALRVRTTLLKKLPEDAHALTEKASGYVGRCSENSCFKTKKEQVGRNQYFFRYALLCRLRCKAFLSSQ